MNNDDNTNSLIDALRQLGRSPLRNKTARLREIFDEVEAARATGASHKQIVDALHGQGLEFTVKSFETTRFRIAKERERNNQPAAQHRVSEPLINFKQEKLKITAGTHLTPATPTTAAENPLRVLSGKPKDGDHNPIPTAKFEVDNS